MSTILIRDLLAAPIYTLNLYEKFLNFCPDDIWNKNFGGWPIGQQFYHALFVSNFFLEQLTGQKAANLYPEAGDLSNKYLKNLPDKTAARKFLLRLIDIVKNLPDTTANKSVSATANGQNETAATLITKLSAELNYHLGACEAALLQAGLYGDLKD